MMKFIYPRLVPPGGFRFLVEKTGMMCTHETMRGLTRKVADHMSANGIEVPDNLEAIIEDYICHNAPAGFCKGDPGDKPVVGAYTLMDIRSNTMTLYKRGGGLAAPGVAQNRIDKCAGCAHNDRRVCTSCTGLLQWSLRLAGNPHRKAKDEWVGVCTKDLSSIVAKVHFNSVAFRGSLPEHCWMSGDKI